MHIGLISGKCEHIDDLLPSVMGNQQHKSEQTGGWWRAGLYFAPIRAPKHMEWTCSGIYIGVSMIQCQLCGFTRVICFLVVVSSLIRYLSIERRS